MQPQTLNVLQVSVGFFFIFFAFNAQGFIEQTVIEGYAEQGRISTYAGYIRYIGGGYKNSNPIQSEKIKAE